jgi:hypothetical protein
MFRALLLLWPICLPGAADAGDPRGPAILNARVESSEDAPAVSANYQFLPGDYVYFSFQISGFRIEGDGEKESRQIALSYEVSMQDAKGIPLAASQPGEIKAQLNPEDKNWIPKRRTSFVIPSFVGAGEYRIHVVAKDLVAGSESSLDVPFHIGGMRVEASENISVQHFSFLRQEEGGEPLTIAAYRPGDTVFVTFDVTGFTLGAGNQYHIAYGVLVLGPDGKPFLNEPNAAQLKDASFYPAQFLPCAVNVITKPSSLRGTYTVAVTVTDVIAKKSYEVKRSFTLE